METFFTVTLTAKQLEVLKSFAFAEERKVDECKTVLPSQRKFALDLSCALMRGQVTPIDEINQDYDDETNPDGVDTYHAWDCAEDKS
jgi:hypothetical protein